MKVTVVIPYFNNEKTIIRALNSVLNQSFKDFEIVIINDGSTDNSYNIVETYIKNNKISNIKHLTQDNLGPSSARNKGILLADGEYIAFLDADDEWVLNKLERQMELIEKYKNIDLLGCNFNIIKDKLIKKKYFCRKKLKKINFIRLLFRHYYATPCVIAKRNVLIECGMFKEDQRFMEDSLLFTKISRNYNAWITNDFLVNTYKNSFGESGLSSNINEMEKWELSNFINLYKENYKSKKKLPLIILIIAILFSIFKYLIRKIVVKIRNFRRR